MIRDQWYVILESGEVRKKPKQFTRMGELLVLWRDSAGKAHCLVDRCCHRGVALSAGKLVDDAIMCPFHGLEYHGDGSCRCIPANSRAAGVPKNFSVPSYPVHEEHGWIWIWWGEGKRQPADSEFTDAASSLSLNARVSDPVGRPEFFGDIDGSFYYGTVQDPWDAHYSRVLENQLDVVHLPFIHHNTIGRGNRTVVDGPGIQWINNRMLYTYVFNRHDDGTAPRKPSEVPVPPTDREFKLEMIMPNLWQNYISSAVRIVGAFVPVDESHTILYLRSYQKFIGLPLVRHFVFWLFGRMNLVIAHQDRRVVQTQTPKASRLQGGEQLIQGDLPIIEYRKKRDKMKKAQSR